MENLFSKIRQSWSMCEKLPLPDSHVPEEETFCHDLNFSCFVAPTKNSPHSLYSASLAKNLAHPAKIHNI